MDFFLYFTCSDYYCDKGVVDITYNRNWHIVGNQKLATMEHGGLVAMTLLNSTPIATATQPQPQPNSSWAEMALY